MRSLTSRHGLFGWLTAFVVRPNHTVYRWSLRLFPPRSLVPAYPSEALKSRVVAESPPSSIPQIALPLPDPDLPNALPAPQSRWADRQTTGVIVRGRRGCRVTHAGSRPKNPCRPFPRTVIAPRHSSRRGVRQIHDGNRPAPANPPMTTSSRRPHSVPSQPGRSPANTTVSDQYPELFHGRASAKTSTPWP